MVDYQNLHVNAHETLQLYLSVKLMFLKLTISIWQQICRYFYISEKIAKCLKNLKFSLILKHI